MTRTASRRAAATLALLVSLATAGCSGEDDPAAAPSASGSGSPAATSGASPGTSPSASAAVSPSASASPPEATGPTVADVYRTTRTAALSAASGHVTGSQTRQGKTLTIDVEGNANGTNQKVRLTSETGGTSEVLTIGEDHWLGGDEAFWVEQTGDASAGAGMVGKFVVITQSDATELGSFTLRSILTERFALPEFAAFEGDTRAAVSTELDGRAAYVLGPEGGARLWVAADGSGTLLRAVGPPSARSDLLFSEWGRAERFAPPPPSAVVEG